MSDTILSQRGRAHLLMTLIGALAIVTTTSSLAWPILAESLRNQGYSESAITLLGERFKAVDLVAANAVFWRLFGIGGMVEPMVVSTSMTEFGPQGFAFSMISVVLIYCVFAACRRATIGGTDRPGNPCLALDLRRRHH
ncbi:MAG: hypothetical protein GDA49_13705 [Rhodospirillales bacterium]|nr:hypothetical protein [Rhodospirillales bacterium]